MAIPSTNVRLSNDSYAEANGVYSSGEVILADISFFSYFAGPNGTNTITYNAYGRGENSGLNRIFGTNAVSAPSDMGDFRGVTYFYDQSTFKCTLTVYNNLGPSVPFPPPPIDTDVQDVNLTLRDEGNFYQYIGFGSGTVVSLGNGGGYFAPFDGSQPTSPLITYAYWTITIGSNPQFPGALADLTVNGSSVFTGQTVSAGPTPTVFDFTTFGPQAMGSTGFAFIVTIY